MQSIAQRVSQRTSLITTERDVRRVLSAALTSPDFWEIVGLADVSFNQVIGILQALAEDGWVSLPDGRVSITDVGLSRCSQDGVSARMLQRCATCEGRGISLERFSEVLARFERLANDRPQPVEQFDQAYVTPTTTLARIAMMADRGDLAGRRLVVLGDDDLVGIAAALTGLPKRVAVVEVDPRFVDYMQKVSEIEGLDVELIVHDLREPLPRDMIGGFDTFFTDPPDTVSGLELFIERGLDAMAGPGCAGYFGMTVVESALPKWRELQRILVGKLGLVITDIIDDFSTYVNWDYLVSSIDSGFEPATKWPSRPWYKSSLYRLETLADWARTDRGTVSSDTLYVGPESLLWTRGGMNVAGT